MGGLVEEVNLEGLAHQGSCALARSLNSPANHAPARLYRLVCHLIQSSGMKTGKRVTVHLRALFQAVPKENMAWTVWARCATCLALKDVACRRFFFGSRIFYQPAVDGLDGQRRYFREWQVADVPSAGG